MVAAQAARQVQASGSGTPQYHLTQPVRMSCLSWAKSRHGAERLQQLAGQSSLGQSSLQQSPLDAAQGCPSLPGIGYTSVALLRESLA